MTRSNTNAEEDWVRCYFQNGVFTIQVSDLFHCKEICNFIPRLNNNPRWERGAVYVWYFKGKYNHELLDRLGKMLTGYGMTWQVVDDEYNYWFHIINRK